MLSAREFPDYRLNISTNRCYGSRDICFGFRKGDATDATVKNPEKYEALCRRRAARARSFVISTPLNGECVRARFPPFRRIL